jgi:hypothetical protein
LCVALVRDLVVEVSLNGSVAAPFQTNIKTPSAPRVMVLENREVYVAYVKKGGGEEVRSRKISKVTSTPFGHTAGSSGRTSGFVQPAEFQVTRLLEICWCAAV